jgi:colanic acid/amylovoran biosynthesis glycosyltransferase
MLKATFCAYDFPGSVGGPGAWIQRLLPALRIYGIESRCLFLTWGDIGPTVAALRAQGLDCPAAPFPEHTEDRVRWVLAQLREDPPDVFVPNVMLPAYFAGRWVRSAGIPTVGILHSDDAFHRGLQHEFVFGQRPFRVSALVCVSAELERQVLAVRPDNMVVRRIPCGAPVPSTRCKRRTAGLRLAYVGRLVEEQKQVSVVARAFCRVARELPDTEAVLFGDGPARGAVEQILATEALGLPVRLAGRVDSDHIQERLSECDVIVLLSDYEGLPIALMEGMACGCVPVCLRTRSGIPELLKDGITGLLVDDRVDSFVAAIRRLSEDRGLWERLSRAARARIEVEYSSRASAAKWADLLTQLGTNGSRRRSLVIPSRLALPPVHPDLAREDRRAPPAALGPLRLYHHARKVARKAGQRVMRWRSPGNFT